MKQKQAQTEAALSGAPQTGNKEAARVAAMISDHALERIRLRDLPTKKDKLLALADAIESAELVKHKIGFNMRPYYMENSHLKDQTGHSCGTVACIAGWASLLDDPTIHDQSAIYKRATSILGLTDTETCYLFSGEFYELAGLSDLAGISTACAIAAIRDLANTGKMRRNGFRNNGEKIK